MDITKTTEELKNNPNVSNVQIISKEVKDEKYAFLGDITEDIVSFDYMDSQWLLMNSSMAAKPQCLYCLDIAKILDKVGNSLLEQINVDTTKTFICK